MNRNDFEIEICAGNIQSVKAASDAGANRVELCDNLMEGGTTPSIGTIFTAKEISNIDVYPIIRPRGGNFVYDDVEEAIMIRDIKLAVQHGADGIVIGVLNSDGGINYEMCSRLIEAAKGLPTTFHRAFDQCKDPFMALESLLSMGVSRLLTSGQKNTAIDGADLIAQLQKSAGDRLKIMPGGGINEINIAALVQKTGVRSVHASLRAPYSQETCFWRNEVTFNGTKDISETIIKASNTDIIKKAIQALEAI